MYINSDAAINRILPAMLQNIAFNVRVDNP